VRIRAALPSDERGVREVCRRIWPDDYVPEVFRDWVKDRRGRLWVALEDDRVVAVAKLTVMPSREAWLHALRVHPKYRRRGIATALLEHRLARARRLGARVARLDTAEDNVAVRRLMRRYGFRRVEVIDYYHASPTRHEPPRLARASETDVLWRLARGRLFHEDYVARGIVRSDIARAIRARQCFAVGDVGRPRAFAIAVAQHANRWMGRSRLRIRLVAGARPAMRELLVALRGLARVAAVDRAGIAPPTEQWPLVRAAGFRRRWHEAMYVFEHRL
jgi:ribosomal protein S18 acetylase RimI-like enzyme